MRIVIVGGGFAGCAAALEAVRMGAETVLLERMDMLCGTGAVGGIMRNNGRYTAAEEMIAMGGGALFKLIDQNCRHKNISFPGHAHASLFDVARVPAKVEQCLMDYGVEIHKRTRVTAVYMGGAGRGTQDVGCGMQEMYGGVHGAGRGILAKVDEPEKLSGALRPWAEGDRVLETVRDGDGNIYEGDVFVDTTGTAGPANMCHKYGNGCAACILRCPVFGGRISLCGLCGVKEFAAKRRRSGIEENAADIQNRSLIHGDFFDCASESADYGAMSGSCKLMKGSLSEDIIRRLDKEGVAIIPVPEHVRENHLDLKACQQYALPEYAGNLVLLDTGHAKLMTPYFPLDKLRQVPGFENARYEDPYAGGEGNSVRFTAMVYREDSMKVRGLANVFCAGEKCGSFVGHTEAIVTGTLAGYNAVRQAAGKALLVLPETLACGDAIHWAGEQMMTDEGKQYKYTFSGSVLFDRMRDKNLYTTDTRKIRDRVCACGMENVFAIVG